MRYVLCMACAASILSCRGAGDARSPLSDFEPRSAIFGHLYVDTETGWVAGLRIALHEMSASEACDAYKTGTTTASDAVTFRLAGTEAVEYSIVPDIETDDFRAGNRRALAKHDHVRADDSGFDYVALGGRITLRDAGDPALDVDHLDFVGRIDVATDPVTAGTCDGGVSAAGDFSGECRCTKLGGSVFTCFLEDGEKDCCPKSSSGPYERYKYEMTATPCPFLCEATSLGLLDECGYDVSETG